MMKTSREETLRLMLIVERKNHLLAMDRAYPDVGMGLLPMLAERQATEQIDQLIRDTLKH